MLYALIFTIVTNYGSPATSSTEFRTLAACEQAGRDHEAKVLDSNTRSRPMWTCAYLGKN